MTRRAFDRFMIDVELGSNPKIARFYVLLWRRERQRSYITAVSAERKHPRPLAEAA